MLQNLKSYIQSNARVISYAITNIVFVCLFILATLIMINFMSKENHKLVELPTPNTGALVRYDNPLGETNYGQARIINNTDEHAYIRVNTEKVDKPHLTLFIRKDQSIRVYLPFDKYKIRLALGKQWFGEWDEALFGKDTQHYVLKESLYIKRSQPDELHQINIADLVSNGTFKTISTFQGTK